jgi:hypothetical protein
MTVDHPQFGTMCEICFSGLTPEKCAEDLEGVKWDVCKGECAKDAGIEEKGEMPILQERDPS